jgi:hypothetical protein
VKRFQYFKAGEDALECNNKLRLMILIEEVRRHFRTTTMAMPMPMPSVALDEALKRVRSHGDVVGAGVMTRSGELLQRVGDFSRERARRCVRLVSVGSHALVGDDDDDDDDDDVVEISRVRRGDCELVVTRSADVVVGVALRASER